jgi:hypothetical protein
MTAVLGMVPMAAALIALAAFGPETRHKAAGADHGRGLPIVVR